MNINNDSNFYNELSIIINHQSILSQKVAILMAINTLIISFIISISSLLSWWIMLSLIIFIIPLIINIYILLPNFKSSNSSNYFYTYKDMNEEEIEKYILEPNILNQIKINSKILSKKYKLYSHALCITFLFFPYIIVISKTCKT